MLKTEARIERVLLIGVIIGSKTEAEVEENLAELELLVKTAGGKVIDSMTQKRAVAHKGLYVGKGKADEIKAMIDMLDIDVVVFDDGVKRVYISDIAEVNNDYAKENIAVLHSGEPVIVIGYVKNPVPTCWI